MRRLLLILILLVFWLVPGHVEAEGEVRLSKLSVDIWPEYDQPAVLMIYRIALHPDTTLPASLAIRIPLTAQINAVAVEDSHGGLINAPYEQSAEMRWSVLKITTNSLHVQVEYYEPLIKDDADRHIEFEWTGDYAVNDLEANFLKPVGAESVSLSHPPTQTSPGQDGLTNYHVQASNLASGQEFKLTIDYRRQTDTLRIASQPVQPVSIPGSDTPGRVSLTDILPWVLAGIGALLIVAGIFGFFAWQRGGQGSTKKITSPRQKVEIEDGFTYCHQCGKRAQPGDVFCRTCGTRLRKGSAD
jgi:hypothetical protein